MKTSTLSVFCAFLTFVTVGCGLQEGSNTPPDCESCGSGDAGTLPPGDAGTTTSSDAGTTTPSGDGGTSTASNPAPVVSPTSCRLEFADQYISGSSCGELRGNLPGMTWDTGPVIQDSNSDGSLEYIASTIAAGTYSMSYMDRECPGQTPETGAWAHYGDPELILSLTADARAWLYCNWYDATTGTVLTDVADPGCNIRVTVGTGCSLSPAGNMRDFH